VIAYPINMSLRVSEGTISPIVALAAVDDIEQTNLEVSSASALEVTDPYSGIIHGQPGQLAFYLTFRR
jgi:hypothetical protein